MLFNRFYAPLYERDYPGAPTRVARADEWIPWERQDAIYADGDFKPERRAATMHKLNTVMGVWGLGRLEEPPHRGSKKPGRMED